MAPATTPDFKTIIIGTGFSGIGMGIKLLEKGDRDFLLLERADDVGGTWRDNRYPGCACDIPSHLYSFSFWQKADWSRLYSPHDEIHGYLKDVASQCGLMTHIRFGVAVSRLVYDEEAHIWCIYGEGGQFFTARYVVAATGPLTEPVIPDIPGLSNFDGPVVHSGRWAENMDLTGKSVAVIGTGASAGQIVPALVDIVGDMTVFQRTPPWVMPRGDRAIKQGTKGIFKRWPGMLNLFRRWISFKLELRGLGFNHSPIIMKIAERLARRYLKKQIKDPALRARVTPDYAIGCKRILMSDDYYPALVRDHVAVITDPIRHIEGSEIVSGDGTRTKADVLVLGTGFHGNKPLFGIDVIGMNGRSLQEEWAKAGPEGYYGVMVSGYPNLFTLHGPNTGLGHNSVVIMLEAQVNLIARICGWVQAKAATQVNVKADVQTMFNQEIQERLKTAVWQAGGCHSWYQLDNGKNVVIWPGLTTRFVRETEAMTPDVFDFTVMKEQSHARAS